MVLFRHCHIVPCGPVQSLPYCTLWSCSGTAILYLVVLFRHCHIVPCDPVQALPYRTLWFCAGTALFHIMALFRLCHIVPCGPVQALPYCTLWPCSGSAGTSGTSTDCWIVPPVPALIVTQALLNCIFSFSVESQRHCQIVFSAPVLIVGGSARLYCQLLL